MKKLKVFVTGADGMLGSNICQQLINQGYHVKAMVLPSRNKSVLNEMALEIVKGNILDIHFLEQQMKHCDFVIHTAALTHVWPRRSKTVMQVNYEGTKNVMKIAGKLKLKRMVHIGTASSFGNGSKEKPGNETSQYNLGRYGLDYIESKYLSQKLLLKNYIDHGFPVIILNPTYMIGPYDSGPSSGKMIIELLKDSLPGYCNGGKNFVCAADVATATVNALSIGKLGECYIVGNENLNYKEFFNKVCKLYNKKFQLVKVPTILVQTLGLYNSIVARIFNKKPTLSYTMTRLANVGQYYSSQKALDELNLPQTPIEKGIQQCVDWFQQNGFLK